MVLVLDHTSKTKRESQEWGFECLDFFRAEEEWRLISEESL